MAVSKTRALKALLSPHGFKQKNGIFYRVFQGESVQAIKLCRERTLQTFTYVAVFSIYEKNLPEYFVRSPALPFSYSVPSFVGKRSTDRVYLTEEQARELSQGRGFSLDNGRPFVYYEPTPEEELVYLRETVLPRLGQIRSQEDVLTFYDELDIVEHYKQLLVNSIRICPALASENYELASAVLSAIFAQNDDAIASYRDYYKDKPEVFQERYEEVIEGQKPLRRIERLLADKNEEEIRSFLETAKKQNLALLK